MTAQEDFEVLMSEYVGILTKQRVLKLEKEDIKAQLLIYIKLNEIEKHISAENVLLTFKTVSRTTLNKAKVSDYCEEHGVNYTQFEVQSDNERLTLKQLEVQDVDSS